MFTHANGSSCLTSHTTGGQLSIFYSEEENDEALLASRTVVHGTDTCYLHEDNGWKQSGDGLLVFDKNRNITITFDSYFKFNKIVN